MENKSDLRREFIGKGLKSILGAGLVAGVAGLNKAEAGGKKIKLLGQDGKLVEVDEEVFNKIQERKKASQADVKNWINNHDQDKP